MTIWGGKSLASELCRKIPRGNLINTTNCVFKMPLSQAQVIFCFLWPRHLTVWSSKFIVISPCFLDHLVEPSGRWVHRLHMQQLDRGWIKHFSVCCLCCCPCTPTIPACDRLTDILPLHSPRFCRASRSKNAYIGFATIWPVDATINFEDYDFIKNIIYTAIYNGCRDIRT